MPEETAFRTARRRIAGNIFGLAGLLQQEGFAESKMDYRLFDSNGLKLRDEDFLEGQQLKIQFNFTHGEKSHRFSATITNDENWNVVILISSSVTAEKTLASGLTISDLDLAYTKVKYALISALKDIRACRS